MAEQRPVLFQLDRTAETSPRRLVILIGAGVGALLLLLWLLRDGATQPPPPQPLHEDAGRKVAAPPAAPSPVTSTALPIGGSVADLRLRRRHGRKTGRAACSDRTIRAPAMLSSPAS